MLTWQSRNMLTWGCFYTSVNFSSWVPTPRNVPSKANKMLMPWGKPGGWGGGGGVAGKAELELTDALVHKIQKIYGYALFAWWITSICLYYHICVHLIEVSMLKTNFCINNCYYFVFFHFLLVLIFLIFLLVLIRWQGINAMWRIRLNCNYHSFLL